MCSVPCGVGSINGMLKTQTLPVFLIRIYSHIHVYSGCLTCCVRLSSCNALCNINTKCDIILLTLYSPGGTVASPSAIALTCLYMNIYMNEHGKTGLELSRLQTAARKSSQRPVKNTALHWVSDLSRSYKAMKNRK